MPSIACSYGFTCLANTINAGILLNISTHLLRAPSLIFFICIHRTVAPNKFIKFSLGTQNTCICMESQHTCSYKWSNIGQNQGMITSYFWRRPTYFWTRCWVNELTSFPVNISFSLLVQTFKTFVLIFLSPLHEVSLKVEGRQ